MNVQAFIPNWPGPKQHASEIENIIREFCPVTVLNDPNDYFNAQWAKARAQFTGDVLLWVMADVTLPQDFDGMFCEAKRLFERMNVGWYAPDIAWTSYIYDKNELKLFEPDIYEVPNTDSLCMFVRGDLVRNMPYINPALSFMWGMDVTAIAAARLMGLKVVRDYRFKAGHPNSTGYSIPKAGEGMIPLFATYTREMQEECLRVEIEVRKLRKPPTWLSE